MISTFKIVGAFICEYSDCELNRHTDAFFLLPVTSIHMLAFFCQNPLLLAQSSLINSSLFAEDSILTFTGTVVLLQCILSPSAVACLALLLGFVHWRFIWISKPRLCLTVDVSGNHHSKDQQKYLEVHRYHQSLVRKWEPLTKECF